MRVAIRCNTRQMVNTTAAGVVCTSAPGGFGIGIRKLNTMFTSLSVEQSTCIALTKCQIQL